MLTKQELVDLAYRQILNTPSLDSPVLKPHVERLVGPAINYQFQQQYFENIRAGDGKEVPSLFVATYTATVKEDTVGDQYIDLNPPLIILPNDRSLVYVGPAKGEENEFVQIPQQQQFRSKNIKKFMGDITTARLDGQKIFFANLDKTVTSVKVKYVADADALKPEDVLPIPAGMELKILDLIVERFLRQRSMGQDLKPNNVDDKVAAQPTR